MMQCAVLAIAPESPNLNRRYFAKYTVRELTTGQVALLIDLALMYAARMARDRLQIRRLLRPLSLLIPRRDREYLFGDLMEEAADLRRDGWPRWRVRLFIGWHFALAVWKALPAAVKGAFWTWLVAKIVRR